MRTSEAIGFARQSADDPRVIEGLAVPYGVVSRPTELTPGGEIVREAWAPGAFSADVAAWSSRADGRRAPFRPRHGERPVGSVEFSDTPEGVAFRARIRPGARGDEYLADVADGLNGVSMEGMWGSKPSRLKDGTVLHRTGSLYGLAGSDSPAYDGAHARLSLRDMEDSTVDNDTPAITTEAAVPAPAVERVSQRDAVAADPIIQIPARITITRAQAVYGPDAQQANGERPRFLRDLLASREGDSAAAERVDRHYRHLDDIALQIERASDVLVAEIPGMYPNDYLPGLLTPRILKGRPMGGYFHRVAISDARPRIFAKVTTSGSVATAADGVALTATDVATTAVTVTPAIYGTYTDISRAAFDGGDPSTEQMVINDLIEGYAQASETVIKTAVEAGATASGTAITAATPFAGTLGNVITYYGTRFRPAGALFIPSALFSVLLAEADTAGRPKMPLLNPMNSAGSVQAGAVEGSVLGSSAYLSYASTANVVVTTRPEDYVIFESPVARFTFTEVVGPTSIRVGIWAYLGVGTRLGGLKVTAA